MVKAKRKALLVPILKKALLISAFFIASNAQALDCPASHIDESAQLRYVHDGDTLKLKDGRKIRLLGIDTPELARKNQPAQPYAKKARDYLKQLLARHQNRLGLAYGIERKDKYGRNLAHLYLSNGQSIQASLLSAGLATAYVTPPNTNHSDCYRAAEKQAMLAGKGIWSLPQYQLKTLNQLSKQDKGFRRIRGRVSRSYGTSRGWWIVLGNRLRVQIKKQDLLYFKPRRLKQLVGKTITLRGWLHPSKKSFYMNLRHPDNMSVTP